jgi:hypothetical protein
MRWLEAIWQLNGVPVLCSMALGFDGEYYNINADEMAAACAIACRADALVFLTDVPGVKGADGEVLRWLIDRSNCGDGEERRHLRRHVAQAGRLPRSAVERREARTDFARGSGQFPARPVQLARSARHRSDGGLGGFWMTKLDQIRAAEARLLLTTYDRSPSCSSAAKACTSSTRTAKYLDLLSGIGVNALGYNHPAIVEAIAGRAAL